MSPSAHPGESGSRPWDETGEKPSMLALKMAWLKHHCFGRMENTGLNLVACVIEGLGLTGVVFPCSGVEA